MIFIKFVEVTGHEIYFVGSSTQAVLDDTDNGKRFGRVNFKSGPHHLSEQAVRNLAHEFGNGGIYLEKGIDCISSGKSQSFVLGWIISRKTTATV